MKNIIMFVAFLSFCCCVDKKKQNEMNETEKRGIPVLDIAGHLSSSLPDTFTWNSIAKSVRIIPLSNKALISGSSYIAHTGDFNVIVDSKMSSINIFDNSGILKSQLRKTGRGPGEYKYPSFVHYQEADSTLLIYDNGNRKLLSYSLNGSFLAETSVKNASWSNICLVEKNLIYTKNAGNGSSHMYLLDNELQIANYYFPYDSTTTPAYKIGVYAMTKTNTKDIHLVNFPTKDTLYSVSKKEIKPICILQKGKHALSAENCSKFIRLPEINDFLTYTYVDLFSSYFLYRYRWNGKFMLELWDLSQETKIAFSELKQPDPMSGLKGGFIYRFASGKEIRIFPEYVTQNRLAFLLPAEECIGEVKGVKEDDNPVLMVMDLK